MKTNRTKDIEELKKLREEIIKLSMSDNETSVKVSKFFLEDLEEIENMDVNENIEEGPKLNKKL